MQGKLKGLRNCPKFFLLGWDAQNFAISSIPMTLTFFAVLTLKMSIIITIIPFKVGGSKQILWEYFFHRPTSRAFWQQRALGEEAAGAEFHNIYPAMPCNAFLQCVFSIYPDTLHCKGSQWVTQWVTMLDVHRPHTHTTWVTMGLTMVRGKRGVGWFWTNALFQVVRRPPLLSFCPPMLFTMSSLLLQLFLFCSCCRETPADFCHPSYRCARTLWGVFQ